MESCGKSRCQGTSQSSCSDQHRAWLVGCDTVCNSIRIAVCTKALEAFVLIYINIIHTIWEKFFRILCCSFCSHDHTVYLIAYFYGHLSRFSDQFECDRMNLASFLLYIDQEISPFILVNRFRFLLKANCFFRAVSDAEATHTAGLTHNNSFSLYCKGSKRTFLHTDTAKHTFICVKFQKFHVPLPPI